MIQVVPEAWAVPERFRKRIGTQAGRQRAMLDSGHLLLILHALPKPDTPDRGARLFWRSPEGEWRATESRGNGLSALKQHLETFREFIQDLDDKIDHARDASSLYQLRRAAAPVLRATRNLHKALQEARDGVEDKDVISLRDLAGDLERNAELVVTDAGNALEYVEAKAAEEQSAFAKKSADAQHRLNLLAALFFPATALGAILGTNLRSGLEGGPPWLFWMVFVFAFAVGFAVRGNVSRDA